jgi:hypothetical protein
MRFTPSTAPVLYVERWGVLNGFRAKLGSWRLAPNVAADLANGDISREAPQVLGSPLGTGALPQKLERVLPPMFLATDVAIEWVVADKNGTVFRATDSSTVSPNRAAAEALFSTPTKKSSD